MPPEYPPVASRPNPTSPGHILAVLRADGPLTRQELQARVGLSRATMVDRLDTLDRLGWLRRTGHQESSGGRRAELLGVDDTGRTALVIDLGQSHATLAVVDLCGTVFLRSEQPVAARSGPHRTLPELVEQGQELLERAGRANSLCAVGLGVPGQVDGSRGCTVAPPTMPEWTGVPLRAPFEEAFGVPVVLENDANALAFGDYFALGRPAAALVGVKIGTGIGAGVVTYGRTHRGESGGAGEIGHMRIEGNEQPCTCGRRGCVFAVASGYALARRLRSTGARSVGDVARLVRAGQRDAVRATADAGKLVGTVLATVVTIVNPRYLRVGGAIGVLPPFLDRLTETVTANAHASALKKLRIEPSALGENATLTGLAGLVADEMLAPATIDAMAQRLA
ncbi:putative NBD/HSP70 family sugar kinase [Tamaricihabitans halophyticus]|uniref:Putative NBD/HSP70 family sugar kinase n=1 Tax=Tamaricihabitans halophyticus TaxID=1262583 RepID=A0A4V2SUB1_9PSEU|nr:ROK family transcriptional regulator [Tamaricihabitans halophyticus]TCP53606.1 putative NBD/HSP70 family sugar kinase [Tamaricihabitans halophyticus]